MQAEILIFRCREENLGLVPGMTPGHEELFCALNRMLFFLLLLGPENQTQAVTSMNLYPLKHLTGLLNLLSKVRFLCNL